ncbi:MAG: hypothetical protein ACJAVJ_000238 [Planctomycetota bacterium]|jgi:hypothetical protein
MFLLQVCAVLASGLSLLPVSGNFEWQASYEDALTQAAAEKKVVFVAVDFEGEGRSENFLAKLTKDKGVRALAEQTLNLVAADSVHKAKGDCSRFKGMECDDHQRVMADLAESVFQVNDEGVFCVPQYIWLDSDANVLLSVPYEIDRDGLVWCFEAAQRMVDPEGAAPFSEEARPPRRLLMGRTYTPLAGDKNGRGMTPEELDLALDDTKSNFMGMVGVEAVLRIMFTDEEEAVEYVQKQLSFLLVGFARNRIPETLHAIGNLSPVRFWEAVEEFSDLEKTTDRREVAVALEQLGASDALKLVKAGMKKEKDAELEGAWVRALAACGAKDKGTRKTILKLATGEDSTELRASAVFGMGYLQRGEDVREVWLELLQGDSVELRVAAACGAALARDELVIPAIEAALEKLTEDELNMASLQRALDVLKGGDLFPIQGDVQRVTGDDVPRERIFFEQVPTAVDRPAGGGGRGERQVP